MSFKFLEFNAIGGTKLIINLDKIIYIEDDSEGKDICDVYLIGDEEPVCLAHSAADVWYRIADA